MTHSIAQRSSHNVDRSPAGKLARTYNSVLYDSKAEAAYAAELDLRKRTKLIRDWQRQIPFELIVGGKRICRHRVDFRVIEMDGSYTYIEVKGHPTEAWKLRKALLLALNPDIRYQVVGVGRA